MGGPHRFDYVHIRRGDKLNATRWPHLDHDTRPEALLQKLPSLVPPNSTLYIATNEADPHFFDPLKTAYTVHSLADFASLWAEGSPWEGEMREVAASVGVAVGERVEFDSEMQVLVDYALKKVARRTVETFNDLTDDPKDGEMRWGAVVCVGRQWDAVESVETFNDLTDDPKDGEMRVLVDYAIKKVARRTVETFDDLTDDPKDGEMRCGRVGSGEVRWRVVERWLNAVGSGGRVDGGV
ncbi:unnamed protein product [Closterium sp. Yama58-4]|nr:unnamed protein product [Closterium sp. Yama58-4]